MSLSSITHTDLYHHWWAKDVMTACYAHCLCMISNLKLTYVGIGAEDMIKHCITYSSPMVAWVFLLISICWWYQNFLLISYDRYNPKESGSHFKIKTSYGDFHYKDIKNNAGVTVNNDFWVMCEAICQRFSRVTKSQVKIIGKSHHKNRYSW